jgi:hypothetical protein
MPSAVDRQVHSEHLTVVKVLSGCRNIVIAAQQSPALKGNSVAEAVGPSCRVHLLTKVLCLKSHGKQLYVKVSVCDWLL